MCDIVDLEEALKKTGGELFKELYRIYPVADPEDYFKNGQWRNDILKADLTLMEAHRREAGAPDMPDLDEITFPKLPLQTSTPTLGGVQFAAGQIKSAAAGTPISATAGGQVVEIRLIALFVAKWKLDPVTAKESLSKLTPARRRYVIQHYKTTLSGVEATEELKKFISECEKDGKWDTVAAATTAAANGTTPGISPGAKVPLLSKPTITPKISPATSATKPVIAAPKPAAVTQTPKVGAAITPVAGVKRPFGATVTPAWAANKRPVLATTNAAKGNTISPPKAGASVIKANVTPKAVAGPPKSGATVRPPVRPGGKLITGLLSNF
jgi:hypothetical protein